MQRPNEHCVFSKSLADRGHFINKHGKLRSVLRHRLRTPKLKPPTDQEIQVLPLLQRVREVRCDHHISDYAFKLDSRGCKNLRHLLEVVNHLGNLRV